jgi:DNA-binding protein Fis
VTVSTNNQKSEHRLPKSIQEVLFKQLAKKRGVQPCDRVGYTVHKKSSPHGYVLVTFDNEETGHLSKRQCMRASFKKLEAERANVEGVRRFLVNEAVSDCNGKKKKAAKMLGIKLGGLNQIIQHAGQ